MTTASWSWGSFGSGTGGFGGSTGAWGTGDEDDAVDLSGYASKDSVIVLIDASPAMFEPNADADGERPFTSALKIARYLYEDKIISNDKDFVSVVFYSTVEKQNGNDFDNIYVYQPFGNPDAERIGELEDLIEQSEAGGADDFGLGSADIDFPLHNALWTCSNLFASGAAPKDGHKRIWLFTNNDNPNRGDLNLRQRAAQRARDLSEMDIGVELFAFNKTVSQPFDVSAFYFTILSSDDDDFGLEDFSAMNKFDEMRQYARRKEFKKRVAGRVPFNLGEGVEIGVAIYNLVIKAGISNPIWLDARDNKQLKSRTLWVCQGTGDTLDLATQVLRYQEYGTSKVVFTPEEVKEIKAIGGDPIMRLLGFKDRKSLPEFYNIKHSQFLYPDESIIKGSTTAFAAILDRMLFLDKIAVVMLIPRRGSAPRLAALLPQAEEVDEDGIQLKPPGMHVIYLPFADDIRALNVDVSEMADAEQIKKLKALVDGLTLAEFTSDAIPNPAIQQHYKSLQTIALEREMDDIEDLVTPDPDGMATMAPLADAARDALYPSSYAPSLTKPRNPILWADHGAPGGSGGGAGAPATKSKNKNKRKRGGGDDDDDDDDGEEFWEEPKPKRKKAAATDLDWDGIAAEGKIAKQTVANLKAFLNANKIAFASKARKADLVALVEAHFAA